MKVIVSVIFIYFNTPKEILNALESLSESVQNISYEVLIIDNASDLPLKIKKKEYITIIRNTQNIGYGKALNRAATLARGTYLLFCNSDILFGKNAIKSMVLEIQKRRKIGVIGPQILSSKKTILRTVSRIPFLPHSLVVFSFLSKLWPFNIIYKNYHLLNLDLKMEKYVPAIGGACMLIRKEVFKKVGGFDKRFFMYFEEADFCYRVSQTGYKVLYYPKSKIIHYVSRSSSDTAMLKKTFESSRFKFFQKYHGLIPAILGELFLRTFTPTNILVFLTFSISLFMNLYKINSDMMFFGDFGRDYLAARDMIFFKEIPLVGIPSSVKWLHQGPLSIYLIGLAFIIGKFNPVAPAILYGLIGVITTSLVYVIGRKYFNKHVGILSSLFYATSPLSVVNARMPYHTSLIPFFACIFFLLLQDAIQNNRKNFFWLFFSLGLLLQVELSNAVVFFILLILCYLYRRLITIAKGVFSIIGFLLGILPFIIYDFTHRFGQTLGFPLWIINRIRLFFGLTISHNSTTAHLPGALLITRQQFAGVIFPWSLFVVIVLLIVGTYVFSRNYLYSKNVNQSSLLITMLWITIPLFGFIIHTTPGPAYFPLLYPAIALVIGYTMYFFIKKNKLFIIIFLLFIIYNGYFTIKNEYFLSSKTSKHLLPPDLYSLGYNLDVQKEIARFIVNNSYDRSFRINPGGSIVRFETSVDNFKYLTWWMGGNPDNSANSIYTIYQEINEVPKNKKVEFSNTVYFVVKDEKQ